MAHITFRLDDVTMTRIEALRAPRRLSRSAALKELIALGLEVSVGGFATVHDAVARANGQIELLQDFVSEAKSNHDEQLQATREVLETQIDLIVKLGIETVMISRALAMARGRPFLAEAQQAAREYFANRGAEAAPAPAVRHEAVGVPA
jgi:hypothetical protein